MAEAVVLDAGRRPMSLRKRVVMIAHDNRKDDLLDWAAFNVGTLSRHELSATGTTGKLLSDRLGLTVTRYLSGPLGGDQQIGAAIAEGRIDLVNFFWDPLEPQPHELSECWDIFSRLPLFTGTLRRAPSLPRCRASLGRAGR